MTRRIIFIVFILLAILIAIFSWINYSKKESIAHSEKSGVIEEVNGPLSTIFHKEYDLETLDGIENAGLISESKACSGKRSSELNSKIEYGINLTYALDDIPESGSLVQAKISAAIWTDDPGEAQWVLEIFDSAQKSLFWSSVNVAPGIHRWDTLDFAFELAPDLMKSGNILKFYPWNKSHASIWIDNINLNLIGSAGIGSKRRSDFKKANYFVSYEPDEKLEDSSVLTDDIAHTGKFSTYLNRNDSYSNSFSKKVSDVTDDTLRKVSMSIWLYPMKDDPNVNFVVTIKNREEQTIFWDARSTEKLKFKAKTWAKLTAELIIPVDKRKLLQSDDQIIVYLWNRSGVKVYADDLEIVYGDNSFKQGILPYADMNLSTRERYSFDRYHGPFRINYLKKTALGNSDYLVSENESKYGKLFPGEEIISLKSKSNKKDVLLHLFESTFELYRWCEEKEKFIFAGKSNQLPFSSIGTKLFSIDIDGDGNSEVLATNNSGSYLFSLKKAVLSSCNHATEAYSADLIWKGEYDPLTVIQIDDFNRNGKEEWLSLNTNSQQWELKEYSIDAWQTTASGKFAANTFYSSSSFCSGYFMPGNHNLQMIVSQTRDSKQSQLFFEYSAKEKRFKPIVGKIEYAMAELFSTGASFIRTNVDKDAQDELLLFRSDWRFDIKLVDCDDKGFYIQSQIDFTGYSNSCNPKYYELARPVYGKFTSADKPELIMVLRNCADEKFDGNSCLNYGGTESLPDQLQLYRINIY